MEIASYIFDLPETLSRWDPKIVLLPVSFSGRNCKNLLQILNMYYRSYFVDLAYEQLYHSFNEAYRTPEDEFSCKHVLHLAWGAFHSNFLIKHGVSKGNIRIKGNPVYSLYRPPYAHYYPSKSILAKKHNLNPDKPWILIPENYKAAFLPDAKLRSYINRGAGKSETYNYQEFDRASFKRVIKWWTELAKLEVAEIIIRPRPVTLKKSFIDACKQLAGEIPANLRFIKAGSVREWILASDAVVSSISTCLIEAAIAQKSVYMMEPITIPSYLRMDWYDFVPGLRTLPEFIDALTVSYPNTNWKTLHRWAENNMMLKKDPILNLVDLITNACEGIIELPDPPGREFIRQPLNYRYQGAEKPLTNQQSTRSDEVKDYPKKNAEFSKKVYYYEHDQFDISEVERRVSRWATNLV